jgi:hypothetical protein
MKTSFIQKTLLTALFGSSLSISSLQAQNPNYAVGDLVLFFQQQGGSNTVYVSLGSAATLYRGTSAGPTADRQKLNIININAELVSAFGVNWATQTNVYAGLAAARSSSTGTGVIDGDQTRTLYVSRPRATVGTLGLADSTPWDVTNSLPYASSGQIIAMGNVLETTYTTAAAVSPTSVSAIDNQNPFLSQGIQGTAFSGFAGGVQQPGSASAFGSFGPAGQVEFALDLNRIVPRLDSETASVEVPGTQHIGTYEGTVVVSTSGMVSFITFPQYASWVSAFNPPLTNEADRSEAADPDGDGIENLLEFVLNGNPSAQDASILPVLDASGSNFVFSFSRRADSAGPVSQVFEYSTDLANWTAKTPITIPAVPGTVGMVTVGPTTGSAPNEVQAVTITIPKGSDIKLFGRLKTSK